MAKTRAAKQERTHTGVYKKKCGSVIHADTSDNAKLINIRKGKKIKSDTRTVILE